MTTLAAKQRPPPLVPTCPAPAQHRVCVLLPTFTSHLPSSWSLHTPTPLPHLTPTPAFLRTHICPRTLGQARAPNAVWSSSSSSQFSHPISAVPQHPHPSFSNPNTHTHSHTHVCAHTRPYRKAAINPEGQASFQSRDHISKVREAGEQETVRVRCGGWSRKEEIGCKR